MGNLFEICEKDDRKYDAGGRLAEDRGHFYHYDCEGNLVFKEFKELSWGGGVIAPINKEQLETELGIRFRAFGTGWRYDWQSDGMLARVVRPDGKEVSFAYDALGRRIRKSFAGTTTHFVWDGNVPLHEWTEEAEESMVTWLFEQDTFVPAAKLVANGDCFSIVSDYLGTPIQAYDKQGNKVWEQELDIYGRQRKRPSSFIPFKYQGQYEDAETGLYYNRFRYYDPKAGSYISQDPIGLVGENPTLYSHVKSPNSQLDLLGLDVYALVATHDGWYPVYEYGTKDPIAYTKLNKGDVYKIGETQHPKTRYSQARLDEARINRSKATAVTFDADGNIIPAGVKMKPISQGGTKKADRQLENSLLKKYNEEHGHLPAGNKHYH